MTASPPSERQALRVLREEALVMVSQAHHHLAAVEAALIALGETPSRLRLPVFRVAPGITLRHRRKRLGLTLAQLACRVDGLTKSAIGAIERGASANPVSIALIERALERLEAER